MSSLLSVHQSTIFAFFSVWLRLGSISIGRYFSYNFFDPSRIEVGTDLHRLNIPKLDSVGLPLAVICLVSVKSKSVTTCNCVAPPWTISFRICSTRCRSRILQCGWFNPSIAFNWIGWCGAELVAIVLKWFFWRHNIETTMLLWVLMFATVAPIASNFRPTNRLNLYAYGAKSKYKYFTNKAFKWDSRLIMTKSLKTKTKSMCCERNKHEKSEEKEKLNNKINLMVWKMVVGHKALIVSSVELVQCAQIHKSVWMLTIDTHVCAHDHLVSLLIWNNNFLNWHNLAHICALRPIEKWFTQMHGMAIQTV